MNSPDTFLYKSVFNCLPLISNKEISTSPGLVNLKLTVTEVWTGDGNTSRKSIACPGSASAEADSSLGPQGINVNFRKALKPQLFWAFTLRTEVGMTVP